MALFYLVRHGQPDYEPCGERGFIGHGRDLAPLSEEGVRQAEQAARDERLAGAELIVASPYTRALQTAAIISRVTGVPLTVETDLHEWIPDLTYRFATGAEAAALCEDFHRCRGAYPPGEARCWETLEHMRARVRAVADKYAHVNRVVLVAHGMALRTIKSMSDMYPAQIVECEYTAGQPYCPYWPE